MTPAGFGLVGALGRGGGAEAEAAIMAGESSGVVAGSLRAREAGRRRGKEAEGR